MSKITPCLWYAGDAEEAARLYTSLLPDSRIDNVVRSPTDYPGGKAGDALVVEFTLAGQGYMALNGGQKVEYTDALSLAVSCEDQAEVDRLWAALGEGGQEVACGWLRDRWGVRWQIVPKAMTEMLKDSDPAKRQRVFQAMMGMVKLDVAKLRAAFEGQ